MSDAQRGNTTHGPALDEQLERESRGLVQGTTPPHVEQFRETEPLPDDTDDEQTRRALERDDQGRDEDSGGEHHG
jgi:hypothetical protein